MILSQRWTTPISALLLAGLLAACGGGGDKTAAVTPGSVTPVPPVTVAPESGPALTGDIALDGLNWINYRRGQTGVQLLTRNSLVDTAALAHSNYQKTNNLVSHEETTGMPGFTGTNTQTRLAAAKYTSLYAYGEVISATSSASGAYMAEELIAAIYHRFAILEPVFKEAGAGAASTTGGYTYLTVDFATVNSNGLGSGKIAVYPFAGQTAVPTLVLSDNESPDPVTTQNEIGYPVSLQADLGSTVAVTNFSMRPRNGANLTVKLLSTATDAHTTSRSVAAIVPLSPLSAATTYDVSFSGTVDGTAVTRAWSFTTK